VFESVEAEEKFYKDSVNEILKKNMLIERERLLAEHKKTRNVELLEQVQSIDKKIQEMRND
jgi:hypothetical protein